MPSAKGAKYDSQGQARSASPLGKSVVIREALKERNNRDRISHFQCSVQLVPAHQGRRALRLPLAIIFRAFGAATRFDISRFRRSEDRIPSFDAMSL